MKVMKVMMMKKNIPIVVFILLIIAPYAHAAANLQVTAFSCSPDEVVSNEQFSCTATVQNTGDAAGTLGTATLYPDGSNWMEDLNYPLTLNTNMASGATTDVDFTGLKGKKTGDNGFSEIRIDDVIDTFVADNSITVNVVDVIVTESSSASSATTGSTVDVTGQATVGGNVDVTLTFSGGSGCSIGNQVSSVDTDDMTDGQTTSHTWTVTIGSSNCAYTVSVEATSDPSGAAVKADSDSGTITCSDCSSDDGDSPGGGGGGGGSTGTGTVYSMELLGIGQSVELNKGDKISFTADGISHSIELKTIIGNKVTIEVSSAPFTVTLIDGVPEEIDVDKDGKNDIEVKAIIVSTTKAKITIKKLILATCSDGLRNQDEVFTDCGGVCPPCEDLDKEPEAKESSDEEKKEPKTLDQESVKDTSGFFQKFKGEKNWTAIISIIVIVLALSLVFIDLIRKEIGKKKKIGKRR